MRFQLNPLAKNGVSIAPEPQRPTNKGGYAGSPDITRVLQPGTNVTFTGSGTQQSPYVVNSSGGGTPGGTNTQLQYNNSGAFGGDTATTDGAGNLSATSLTLSNLHPLAISSGGTGSATQNFVDLSSTQSAIGGAKTFTATTTTFNNIDFASNGNYTIGSTSHYGKYGYISRLYLNSTAYMDGGTAGQIAVSTNTNGPVAGLTINNNTTTPTAGFAPVLNMFAPSIAAGNLAQFRLGVAASTFNAAEFNFKYNNNGANSNTFFFGLYGNPSIVGFDGVGQVTLAQSSGFTAAGGSQYGVKINPTINQTSTAGYTALLVNPTETATGSGTKLLADFQVGGTSKFKIDDTGIATGNNLVFSNNAVTVTTNAGTCSASYRLNTFTNSSAATMAITLSTSGAVDGKTMIVRVYDFSAVAQTIGWTNTENSTVSVPTTSNGSTTLPKTVTFMYNAATSLWRCISSV
jgi:hypothetical protein